MQLYIDNRSGAPIYDQIYSQIKDAILSGQVAEGEALPSIRALAKDCASASSPPNAPMTSWKTRDLSTPCPARAASWRSAARSCWREENLRKIESHMQEIRRLANACRLTEQELDDMWRLQKEEAE